MFSNNPFHIFSNNRRDDEPAIETKEILHAFDENIRARDEKQDFLEQSKHAASNELQAASRHHEALVIQLSDLDTMYEKQRKDLVEKIHRADIALNAAEKYLRNLSDPSSLDPEEEAFHQYELQLRHEDIARRMNGQ